MSTLRRSAALAAALCAVAAHAGLKITMEMKRHGKTSSMTMQMEGKNLRMEMTKDGETQPGGGMISDGDNKKIVMISYDKKEYHELTQEQMKAMRAKADAAMAQMKEKLAQLPPAQRQQIEAALAQNQSTHKSAMPDEKYTRASGSKTVAGYKCELYTVESEGKKIADACLIPWSDVKGVDREQLKQSVEAMADVWGGFGMDLRSGEKAPNMIKAWGLSSGIPGWRKAVKTDEEEGSESTLTSLTQGAIPRSAFEPPAGFTRKTIDQK
jgi:hypothetical protein